MWLPKTTFRYTVIAAKKEIKDYNVIIDGRYLFDQPTKNDSKRYDNIRKIVIDLENDCTTGCLLDYIYFKEHYKVIAINLIKQKKLDADSKAIQHLNFTGNVENNATTIFITEEAKETVLDFSKGTVKVLWSYF